MMTPRVAGTQDDYLAPHDYEYFENGSPGSDDYLAPRLFGTVYKDHRGPVYISR